MLQAQPNKILASNKSKNRNVLECRKRANIIIENEGEEKRREKNTLPERAQRREER